MTWETIKSEAYNNGLKKGVLQGQKQKAVEAAIKVVRKYKATPEDAAKDMNAPLELVLEGLKQEPVTQQI